MRSMLVFIALAGLVVSSMALAAVTGGPSAHSSLVGGTRDLAARLDDESGDDETGDDEGGDAPLVRNFDSDPLGDPSLVVDGDGLQRVEWVDDAPAFVGDAPGSLSAIYDSSLPAGRVGFSLPRTLSESDRFTAAAVFVIHSAGFVAEPDGFFQISWGLWNRGATGLNRTGTLSEAADCYELVEFDWFPAVSPFFGGPFLGPGVFGRGMAGDDAFDNFSSFFDVEVALPLDVPLMAVIEHQPGSATAAVQLYRVLDGPALVPVNSGVGAIELGFLSDGSYSVDSVGLTLWQDGFDGLFAPSPSVWAELTFHRLVVVPDFDAAPLELFDVVAP